MAFSRGFANSASRSYLKYIVPDEIRGGVVSFFHYYFQEIVMHKAVILKQIKVESKTIN